MDLCICLILDLKAPMMFWLYLPEIGNLKVWRVHRFDIGVDFDDIILGLCFETWNRCI